MCYSLYIDRIFLMHFAVNLCLLFLTAKSGGLDCRKKRIFGAAAAGAGIVTAAMALPMPFGSRTQRLGMKLVCLAAGAGVQIFFAFSCRNQKIFRRAALLYGACACIMGGALGAAKGLQKVLAVGKKQSSGTETAVFGWFSVSLFCIMTAYAGWRMISSEKRRSRSPLWKVSFCRNGNFFSGTGLLDSGNGLYDPYTKMPVCLIEQAEAERLGIFEENMPVKLIPYHCVGKKHGLLRAVTVDEMYLEKEGQEKRIGQVTLAVSPEPLSASGAYRVILHPALLEEKKGANHDLKSSDAGKHAV